MSNYLVPLASFREMLLYMISDLITLTQGVTATATKDHQELRKANFQILWWPLTRSERDTLTFGGCTTTGVWLSSCLTCYRWARIGKAVNYASLPPRRTRRSKPTRSAWQTCWKSSELIFQVLSNSVESTSTPVTTASLISSACVKVLTCHQTVFWTRRRFDRFDLENCCTNTHLKRNWLCWRCRFPKSQLWPH